MSPPFDLLGERLLEAGVRPDCVRRCLDDLAEAMKSQSRFRSLAARTPRALLSYTMLRRRVSVGAAGIALAGLLTGCAGSPPPADELLRQIAARQGGSEDTGVVAQTPEDRAAMDRAAAEIRTHLAAVPDLAPPGMPDGAFQVSVTASHSMAGSWKMVSPTRIDMRRNEPDSYTQVRTFLCRLDQDGDALEGSCLPSRDRIHGAVRGDEVRLGWESGLIGAEIRGRLVTPIDFAGTFTLGTLGVGVLNTDIPAYGSKISVSPVMPEGAAELAAALAGDVYSDEMSKQGGGVQSMSLLGFVEKPIGEGDKQGFVAMAVYDVEFAHGWKLCGFTRDGDGRIDSVECR